MGDKKFSEMSPEIIKKLLNLPKEKGIELFKRINYRFHLEKENILKQAFEENLFTKKEYEEKYKDMFYDDHGSDSFIQYINAVMNAEINCFVTQNERMIGKKEELKKRFGLKIASPKEIIEKKGDKNAKNTAVEN